ncbi:ThyA Thymidylate synthase [uncultured Caudovirales phage]|uniref:thymidylate synthase n=1 Tax=uncultured Caudovirales phage TaxID=2100421 RepID=A0A6J5MF07_9CAUD|nr:ThyA Thymidylate synthase [uncultured Caudovirales phage]
MNNIDKAYKELLEHIIHFGVEKEDRTGTGTKSIFGWQIRHRMSGGFPLLTTKKMAWKAIVTELLWFLKGRTDLRYLLENNCHIWSGDAYKVYDKEFDAEHPPFSGPYPRRLTVKEFEEKIMNDDAFNQRFGDLGSIYGKQWRKWEVYELSNRNSYVRRDGMMNYRKHKYDVETKSIDQIQNLINDLKTNPDSRRLMVNAWNVGELDQMTLPPCHYGFQVYTRELSHLERYKSYNKIYHDRCTADCYTKEDFDNKGIPTRAISLCWSQRSVDTGLGLSFNIASYSLLLMMIAKQVNMVPDEVIGNLGDVHLYLNHIEPIKEQLTREPYELPTVKISDRVVNDISEYTLDDIVLENYKCHPVIKLPLSN